MSMKYSKADLRHIAEYLIEDLRECEDGTVTNTATLAKNHRYSDIDNDDLFDLHDALFRAAKANKITLDMSEHEGKFEGLPFNLAFVVRNKRAQIKCPHCGSKNTARYIYGEPSYSKEMQEKLENGKWVLGGCCISCVEVNGQSVDAMPTRHCNECGKDFGTPPILITPKRELVEDYRDIVTAIKFGVGGFFNGHTEITIKMNEKGALVKVRKMSGYEETPEPKQITPLKWNRIVNTLYGQMYLHEWKKKYVDPDVLDGTQWSLDIHLTDNRVRHYYGSNEYPPYWPELEKIFRGFAKL